MNGIRQWMARTANRSDLDRLRAAQGPEVIPWPVVSTEPTAMTAPVLLPAQRKQLRLRRLLKPHGLLVIASLAYITAVATLVPLNLVINWDEIVYISQLGIGQVPMYWGGHRAWGSVLLMAPVSVFTKSVIVLRAYLIVLAGLAIFTAFRPWLSVFPKGSWVRYTAPLAATVFGFQWLSILHGPMGFPNLWLAFGLVAGTGYFVRAVRESSVVGLLCGCFISFAIAAIFRPTDAIAAAAPIVSTLFVRRWRIPRAVGAVVGGLTLGTAPWIIEAFIRFGGPLERLQASASRANAGLRLRFVDQFYSSDGPYTLCSPNLCHGVTVGMAVWWIGLPLVAVTGVWLASRRHDLLPMSLAVACAAVFSGPYFTIVGDSHPRFLSPAYALLALPAAYALLSLASMARGNLRWLGAAIIGTVLVLQITVHYEALQRALKIQIGITNQLEAWTERLQDQVRLEAPCLLYGLYTVGLSYNFGCDRIQTSMTACPEDESIRRALGEGSRVILIYRGDLNLCEPYSRWQRIQLQDAGHLFAAASPASP